MRTLPIALFAFALVAAPAEPAQAQKPTTYGIKGGLVMPGTFYWHEGPYVSYNFNLSWSAGAFIDHMLAEKLSGGLYLDLNLVNAFDESAVMFDVGATLKARLAVGAGGIQWRPMIGIGYGNLGAIYLFDGTSYLTLKGGAEALIPMGARQVLVEGLVFGAPNGGNEDVTTTFGPVFQLRFGLLF